MTVRVRVRGLPELKGDLKKRSKNLSNLQPLFKRVAALAERKAKEAFQKETDPVTGIRWEPLKSGASDRKRDESGRFLARRRILSDTGVLKNSVVGRLTKRGVDVTSPLEYAAIHQFGGMAGKDKDIPIPQRRYAGLSDDDFDRVLELTVKHANKGT